MVGMSRSAMIALWLVGFIALIILAIIPESFGVMRISQIALCVFSIAVPAVIWRKSKWALATVSAMTVAILLITILPNDRAPRASTYRDSLLAYDGTAYVWGGENSFGVDCSGLLRRAYVRACVIDSVFSFRPTLLKEAFHVWWRDCSARELRDGYSGRTAKSSIRGTVNDMSPKHLLIGDMAITSNGVHCLAYLGQETWIEADPALMRVVTKSAPDSAFEWFSADVVIVRWRNLGHDE